MSKYISGNQKHLTLEDCKYKECLSQSRAGINITRHELHQEDMVITPLIFQGQSPYQIITNHPELDISMLRMILPKKTSFEYLTQWDLRTIVDHINSTPRESLGGRTPYDVALAVLGFIQCLSNLLNQCHIHWQLLYICIYIYLHSYIQLKSPPVTASDNSLSIFSTSSTPLTI